MIEGSNHGCTYLANAESHSFSLSGHEDYLFADFYLRVLAQNTGQHELCALANGVYGRVLDDYAREVHQQYLEWHDRPPEVGLVPIRLLKPLGIQHVVHRHHVVALVHVPRPHSSQLLHVSSRVEHQPQVLTQRADLGACLARDPQRTQAFFVLQL